MTAARIHRVNKLHADCCLEELDGCRMDKSYATETLGREDVDIVRGSYVVARFRASVLVEAELATAREHMGGYSVTDVADGFLYAMDHLFSSIALREYASRNCRAAVASRGIDGTCFSDVSVSEAELKLTRYEGHALVTFVGPGTPRAGLAMLPQYRCGIDMRPGDLLIVTPGEWIAVANQAAAGDGVAQSIVVVSAAATNTT